MLVFSLTLVNICIKTVNEFLTRNGPQLAASISYYALFSLFPLTLAIIFATSFFLGPESIDGLALRAAEQAPVSQETVSEVLGATLQSRNFAGIAGILGLLWAGTAVFGAIRKGVNATWGITQPRPFLQERLIDISLMLGAAILMLVSIFSTAALLYLREIVEFITLGTNVNGEFLSGIWDLLASLIPPTLSLVVFVGLYWFLPNTKVRMVEALPGAIAATLAFEGAKYIFVWYVRNYPIYTSVYGSVGSIVALLVWVYISALILLFGSLITSRYAAYMASRNIRVESTIMRTNNRKINYR